MRLRVQKHCFPNEAPMGGWDQLGSGYRAGPESAAPGLGLCMVMSSPDLPPHMKGSKEKQGHEELIGSMRSRSGTRGADRGHVELIRGTRS